jgi:hypothetical protein
MPRTPRTAESRSFSQSLRKAETDLAQLMFEGVFGKSTAAVAPEDALLAVGSTVVRVFTSFNSRVIERMIEVSL